MLGALPGLGELGVAFLGGVVSFLAPCVLPLVPGYLSAVSAVSADKLGEPGQGRRVALASLPFLAGLTIVFVALGVGAADLVVILESLKQAGSLQAEMVVL